MAIQNYKLITTSNQSIRLDDQAVYILEDIVVMDMGGSTLLKVWSLQYLNKKNKKL